MIDSNRRTITLLALLAPVIPTLLGTSAVASPSVKNGDTKAKSYVDRMPLEWRGKEKIAIVIYNEMTPLDVFGPHYYLHRLPGAQVDIVSHNLEPVHCEGLIFTPTATFESCPKDLDVLLVGGGTSGTLKAMQDPSMLDFLADRGSRAKWVTSVCTGSLLLGQAGLLEGYKATCHWLGRPLLRNFGAIEVDERVVFDRNRATGAGVSAGLDLTLELIQRLRPIEFAQAVQLLSEYSPEPPLDVGTPDKAPPEILKQMRELTAGFVDGVNKITESNPESLSRTLR